MQSPGRLYNAQRLRSIGLRQKGFAWFGMAFLMNGVYSSLNGAQQRLEGGTHRQDMIIITFLTTAFFSVIYLRPDFLRGGVMGALV